MLKNLLCSFIFHTLIVILSIILIFIVISNKLYPGPLISIPFSIIVTFIYIFLGYKMNLNRNISLDLLSISVPSVIGSILFFDIFFSEGFSFTTQITEQLSGFWLSVHLYNLPFRIAFLHIDYLLTNNSIIKGSLNLPIIFLITIQFPSLFMWIGLEIKRFKYYKTSKNY
ncbi:hypothetical protein PV797_15925 [Clostridiaceae bacterium M8S5]|nr:hypothetical protein PV797_15925 [Clostridiaceae bacterium M8S5]